MKRFATAAIAILLAFAASAAEPPGDSIYQLDAALVTQSGAAARLDLDRGAPTLIALFYASCRAVCPATINGIQSYERRLDATARSQLRVLMVSLDGERDTPQNLAALARKHRVDPDRWTFARADDADVRKIAALLGVQYRRAPSGDYDHTALITLLDGEGRIVAHTSQLSGDQAFAAQLRGALR
ncbi:SCO family protein [Solimonas variicoloris]|uniref:SCO family protein n=1 Tax=Solimonas variicoloris TaxID=254408 RepID=UPI00037EEF49|nr:SCO family protein [Solimonas variicoloris]